MTDTKEVKQQRGDNVQVQQLEVKASTPDAVPNTHSLIEKLSANLAKYVKDMNSATIDRLGLDSLLKLSPGQKILALRQTLFPRIHGIELWLEDMANQHKIELSRDNK